MILKSNHYDLYSLNDFTIPYDEKQEKNHQDFFLDGHSSGTWSIPPGWKGWHFTILFMVSHPPRMAPNRLMDSIP
jgi:hypothetical protein